MKEVQGKSILVRVIGSRLSLEDFARILKKKKTRWKASCCFCHQKGIMVIYTEGG